METEHIKQTKSQNEYNKLISLVKSTVDNLCVLSVEVLVLSVY